MGTVYATLADIRASGYPLSAAQETAATTMLEQASAKLRIYARKVGKDIDAMIADTVTGEDYALAVRSVIVQAVCRALNVASSTTPAASSISQSGLGYSATVSYANAGQSLYFQRAELRDLGLMTQQWGALEVYGNAAD